MKILVCIKQIADPDSEIRINNTSTWIDDCKNTLFRINRYDEYALEEALLIKDKYKDTIIDIVSVGPERMSSTVKKSLEKGVSKGIHIRCNKEYISAAETASLIAEYAKDKDYDIIFTGVMSEDLMQGQVGPMIAACLSIPCAVSVIGSELNSDFSRITVLSELEGGVTEHIDVTLPCLITVQSGVNRPRYPSLSNVMAARTMSIITIDSNTINNMNYSDDTISLEYPIVASKGVVIAGNIEEKAERFLNILHEKGLL
ncbi:MAG: electron transfer flavoprotein subunit beta/FixA family protein [Leptospirales bacterium]|nr:electron transfer flavoprotein subunit beta/FixA family protein [Leptospirales bacterium]